MKLTITKKAQSSADKIKKCIEKDSPTEATNVIKKFAEEMEIIQMFPNSGMSLSNKIDKSTDLKYKIVYSYAIVYKMAEDEIIVVNILHLRRDFNRIKFWLKKGVNEDMENVKGQPIYIPNFGVQGSYVISAEEYNEFIRYQQEKLLLNKLDIADKQIRNGEVYSKEEMKKKLGIKWN